jgi:hypothetical protein
MSRSALFVGRLFGGKQFGGRQFTGQSVVVPGGGHKHASRYPSPHDDDQHFIGRQNDVVIALVIAAITQGLLT